MENLFWGHDDLSDDDDRNGLIYDLKGYKGEHRVMRKGGEVVSAPAAIAFIHRRRRGSG